MNIGPSPDHYDSVREFLAETGWHHRVQDTERFSKMMEGTTRTIVAFEGHRVVGFGRVLCNGVSNGYLSMLAVEQDKRRQGIGREIVNRLIEEDEDVIWMLRTGRESQGFWQKLGFVASVIAMELTRRTK